MDNNWSSQLKTPWRAAHRHQISENDCENADIPNICEEVRGRLAGGGRRAGGVLQLGPATELLHGAALLLLDKTERTLQDTFELSQKIMLKNYQNVHECWNSDELETEESDEDGDSEVERVPSFGKRSDRTNDLEMSKSLRTNEVLETESDSGNEATLATSSDELGNGSHSNGRSQEEARAAQEVRAGGGPGRGRGRCGRGLDPRLRLGVMLIYENCTQNVPNKIFISSINPRTKL